MRDTGHINGVGQTIELEGVIYETAENRFVDIKTLSLGPSGTTAIMGPNGAGKSSLMRTLATLQEVDNGTAYLGEIDILKNPIA